MGITQRSATIAFGVVTAKQGKGGRLVLRLSPAARKLLGRLARAGVKSIRAQAVIVSTIIPGVTTTKIVTIRISLVPAHRNRR